MPVSSVGLQIFSYRNSAAGLLDCINFQCQICAGNVVISQCGLSKGIDRILVHQIGILCGVVAVQIVVGAVPEGRENLFYFIISDI